MKLYSEGKSYKLYQGNMLDMLDVIEPDSIDAIVTDPPYELGFMSKSWDSSGIAFQKDTWEKCLKVLKPGGYLLSFGGSRTFHRIACAIEDAGFEIRDTIMWLYGCLSEDTEVLTQEGFKKFNDIKPDESIKIYDLITQEFSFEVPSKWSSYQVENEDCYSIKSDYTDQIVSKNHRCIVIEGGKHTIKFAENLNTMEQIPYMDTDSEVKVTFATVTKISYTGTIFCPTVSTGCFVARRNGKVFITGNSGFPKSMNIGLAIDKKNGVDSKGEISSILEDAQKWQGWGTALKPAYESITVAMKPLSDELFDNVISIIKEIITICQLSSDVQLVEKISQLNPVVLNGVVDTVPKNVNKNNKWVDLLEVMGILQLCVMESMNWNIVSLCLKYLEEICYHQSKFTIEMRTSLIIDLKTLNSLLVPDILQNTMLPSETSQHGIMPNVSTVEKFLLDAIKKLNDILMNFVVESATKRVEESNLLPNYEPIVVARKPCEGSCIENVLKYGVGGINIDECRVGDDLIKGGTTPNFRDVGRKQKEISGIDKLSFGQVSNAERIPLEDHNGRYPANVILTYDETDQEEVCGGMPESKGASSQNNFSNGHIYRGQSLQESSTSLSGYREWYNDEGSAARYFYCAKASKRDRDEGCDDLDDKYVAMGNQAKAELKRGNLDFTGDPRSPLNSFNTVQQVKNSHPCVKPCDLMQYLVRLVTPKNGTVLDPFNGSGSTGKAVAYENFDRDSNYRYIGIELSEEYLAISDARIKFVENTPKQFKLF